jgi:hypothetical protein
MNFPESWWNHIPGWAILPVIGVAFIIWVLSKLAGAHAGVAKLIPVFGKIWHARANRPDIDAELADLRRQVEFQGKQLEELRNRDEMYWAWILMDQEWHRAVEFAAVTNDWKLPPHISFMQFRDGWLASHPKKEELKF